MAQNSLVTTDDRRSVEGFLEDDERIIWVGKPRQGFRFGKKELFLSPFAIFWTGFSVFWMGSAALMGAPLPFVLFGTPFVGIGIYLLIGRHFVDARNRKNTVYVVTNKRVLIKSGVGSSNIKMRDLDEIELGDLEVSNDGTGDIPMEANYSYRTGSKNAGKMNFALSPSGFGFYGIDDVQQIFQIIKREADDYKDNKALNPSSEQQNEHDW